MDKVTLILGERTIEQAAQALLDAPEGWVFEVKPPTRSIVQNSMLHATIANVAKQRKFMDRVLHTVQWKTIFISGHSMVTGFGSDMVPGLEGEFVNIRESSATMGVGRMSSLIEYCLAWCANNGVRLPVHKSYEELHR